MLSGLHAWFKSLYMEVKLYVFYRQMLAHMGMLPCYMWLHGYRENACPGETLIVFYFIYDARAADSVLQVIKGNLNPHLLCCKYYGTGLENQWQRI